MYIYFSGENYFSSIVNKIQLANKEIHIEMYMFNFDILGKRILHGLKNAAERGVKVNILVDGIGSITFLSEIKKYCNVSNINFSVYNPVPFRSDFLFRFSYKLLMWSNIQKFIVMFSKLNNRNHRKLILIDQKIAFVGSQNISQVHSEEFLLNKAWRDTGVEIFGDAVKPLIEQKVNRSLKVNKTTKFVRSFDSAHKRIWITTAYFSPKRRVLKSLIKAAKRGVDVCICLPAVSDLPFMRWLAWTLYDHLLQAGIKIYEFQGRVLHAKTMILDSYGTIGSCNLNYRSLIHDLEIEVKIKANELVKKLEEQWEIDIKNSKLVDHDSFFYRNSFYRLLGKIVYVFRYWL